MTSPFDKLASRQGGFAANTVGSPVDDFSNFLNAAQESGTAVWDDIDARYKPLIPGQTEAQGPPAAPTPEAVKNAVESAARQDPTGLAQAISAAFTAKTDPVKIMVEDHPVLTVVGVAGFAWLLYRSFR